MCETFAQCHLLRNSHSHFHQGQNRIRHTVKGFKDNFRESKLLDILGKPGDFPYKTFLAFYDRKFPYDIPSL